MKGWKTWAGAGSIILAAVAAALHALSQPTIDLHSLVQAFVALGGGLATIGLGHKVEKAAVTIAALLGATIPATVPGATAAPAAQAAQPVQPQAPPKQ